jgi:Mn-dependent DtxR family transcriptional regulator
VDDAEVLEELPATTREVAARLDARASAVGMRLRRMRERGLVRYVRGGGRVVWEAVG